MRLTLASASPRRRQYLALLTLEFDVVPSAAEEIADGAPRERVLKNAVAKARSVAALHAGVIVGADTVVEIEGCVLEKPRSRAEARTMLRRLSDRTHRVLTGLCVLDSETGAEFTACEETDVTFRTLSDREIERYLDTGEHVDKAGAYGIQGRAAPFVEGIQGDYYNVVGLPLCRLALLLREAGVDV